MLRRVGYHDVFTFYAPDAGAAYEHCYWHGCSLVTFFKQPELLWGRKTVIEQLNDHIKHYDINMKLTLVFYPTENMYKIYAHYGTEWWYDFITMNNIIPC
jgi:hypothetical protein